MCGTVWRNNNKTTCCEARFRVLFVPFDGFIRQWISLRCQFVSFAGIEFRAIFQDINMYMLGTWYGIVWFGHNRAI